MECRARSFRDQGRRPTDRQVRHQEHDAEADRVLPDEVIGRECTGAPVRHEAEIACPAVIVTGTTRPLVLAFLTTALRTPVSSTTSRTPSSGGIALSWRCT